MSQSKVRIRDRASSRPCPAVRNEIGKSGDSDTVIGKRHCWMHVMEVCNGSPVYIFFKGSIEPTDS